MSDQAGKKYIGQIPDDQVEAADNLQVFIMENAWAFIEMDLPIGGPQGMGIQHVTHCRPLDQCFSGSKIRVSPTMVHFFSDMEATEQRRNKDLVEKVAQAAIKARAESSGLTLVPAGAKPAVPPPGGFHGPGRPPGLS